MNDTCRRGDDWLRIRIPHLTFKKQLININQLTTLLQKLSYLTLEQRQP